MAKYEPTENQINADLLVVGGGITGITAAIDVAELGKEVLLIDNSPSIGGRVASMNQYFPKLCPPTCGLEINYKRIRSNKYIRILTLASVEKIDGAGGDYTVQINVNPRYVNERCTACGDCETECEIETVSEYNYNMNKVKAIRLPHEMAFPFRFMVDPNYASNDKMKKCVDACKFDAIDLDMKPRSITVKVRSIIWATGWKPYDAQKIENLGFGKYKNVITNVMMERLAAENGPTDGKIVRPSDHDNIPEDYSVKKIGFIQCAGSRDENHLPYCSAVCCMASMKQATYVREQYPDAEIYIFYIDIRSPGRQEDFYTKLQDDEKTYFIRGKVAMISENPESKNLILEAENTLSGEITKTEVDLAVLAVGMEPNTKTDQPPIDIETDDFGFIAEDYTINKENNKRFAGAGTSVRPFDVVSSVQNATGVVARVL
jgi:quinone-modifying oxidoreductase subunit QmoA